MEDKRIALITGGTGYVGSSLAKRLISNRWEVHIIVRAGSSLASLSSVEKQVHLHEHDGSTDGLVSIMETVKPNVVFHLASLFLAQHTHKDVVPLIQSNITFATQLVEAMVQNNVKNLVNTGTSWQHFENKRYSPVCLYAATKQAFEAVLH
jgi:nucleoside-diphosphate-sugar epimerase